MLPTSTAASFYLPFLPYSSSPMSSWSPTTAAAAFYYQSMMMPTPPRRATTYLIKDILGDSSSDNNTNNTTSFAFFDGMFTLFSNSMNVCVGRQHWPLSLDTSTDVTVAGNAVIDHRSELGLIAISMKNNNNRDETSPSSSSFTGDLQQQQLHHKPIKKKKARTTFSGRQIFELEKQFELKKYLSSSERGELAKLLNVTETQVRSFVHSRG